MKTDSLIHWLTLASSACASLLAFSKVLEVDLPAWVYRDITTGLAAAIAAIGAVLTVLRGSNGGK